MATTPETLCCVGARPVIEITREVTFLSGKNKGAQSAETIHYISSMEMQPERAGEVLGLIREYWDIEGGLHQRLDVTAREDSSRVRHRNAILVLGILRRSMMGHFFQWRRRRQNKRQSTLLDFYDAMNAFNNRLAFSSLKSRPR